MLTNIVLAILVVFVFGVAIASALAVAGSCQRERRRCIEEEGYDPTDYIEW